MTDTRERGKVDFQDVAKLATLTQKPESADEDGKPENSGMIHLSALAAGEVAGPDGAPTPCKKPTPPPPQRAIAAPAQQEPRPMPRPPSAPLDAIRGPHARTTRFPAWITLAGGMVLGGLMAGVLFATRASSSARTTVTGSTLPQSTQGSSLPNKDTMRTPIAAAAHGTTVEDHAVDPAALPAAPIAGQGRASASPSTRVPAGAAGLAQASRSMTASGPQVGATGAAGPAAPAATVPEPGTDDSLEALIKRSVAGSDRGAVGGAQQASGAGPVNTAFSTAGLPAKPAMGAVQGAVGTVMPAARYCLGPDDPVSRATITFKSDGSVQNIAVTGDAAGQPAEGCIRSRLMGARVPPFTSPTFTWTVTVRPAS